MDRSAPDPRPMAFGTATRDMPSHGRLTRIADLLGCPVSAFADGAADDSEAATASELLRLWLAIDDDADRGKVLALARELAKA